MAFTSRKQVRVTNTPLHSKTGVYRGIHFFLFLLQNIDCGYLLEPPHLKMNIFTAVNYFCILHGRICVMNSNLFVPLLHDIFTQQSVVFAIFYFEG